MSGTIRIFFIFLFYLQYANCYKIILFVPTVTRSNVILYVRLGDALVTAGHDVTLYRPHYSDQAETVSSGLCKEVRVPAMEDREKALLFEKYRIRRSYEDTGFFSETNQMFMKLAKELMSAGCELQATNKAVLEKLRAEKFDLAIANMYEMCPFGIIKLLEIPTYIWMSSSVLMEHIAWSMGVPSPPSFVPGTALGHGDQMKYMKRMKNFVAQQIARFVMPRIFKQQTTVFRKHYGEDFPDLNDLAAQSQLVFINSDEIIDFPRPILHKIIYIGGIGMEKPKKLNKEFESIINSAKSGAIFVSLGGSGMNSSDMPIVWKETLLKTASRMPDYTFIVKYECNDINEMARAKTLNNFHTYSWLPQLELLAHPKVKLFVTHGGHNSILEAAYAGKPVACLPMFGDQFYNCKSADRHGYGVVLKKKKMHSSTILVQKLKKVLNEQTFQKNATRISQMLAKKPTKPEVLAVKWVEFLAEFRQLPNLQPVSVKLNLIEYFCLDVLAGIFSVVAATLYLLYRVVEATVCKFCRTERKNKKKKQVRNKPKKD